MQAYLAESAVIDFSDPEILALAGKLERINGYESYAPACFSWVQNEVQHSADCESDVVTCNASEVLRERVGICYAKSHLLVALLRARGIPAGFVYQRLALDVPGKFCLHGLAGIWSNGSWYRVDPRGGARGAGVRFTPPVEHWVYESNARGEWTSSKVLADPLPIVVASLRRHRSAKTLLGDLPDLEALISVEN